MLNRYFFKLNKEMKQQVLYYTLGVKTSQQA